MVKYISSINKNEKKEKVLLVGRGPSVDKLKLKFLNKKDCEYDICAISDAQRLFTRPKFVFHYHYASLVRCIDVCNFPQYLLIGSNAYNDYLEKKINLKTGLNIEELDNLRVFNSRHRKLHQIEDEQFEIDVRNTLYNYCGSVVGAFNFLAGYMQYKEIYYIGFDGGINYGNADYGNSIGNSRKQTKVEGSKNKYFESWKGTIAMSKFYPGIKLLPMEQFLNKEI